MRTCAIVTCSACYAFFACRKSASKVASRTPCCAFCALCVCFLRCPRAARAACNEATRAARIVSRRALPDRSVPSVDNGIYVGQTVGIGMLKKTITRFMQHLRSARSWNNVFGARGVRGLGLLYPTMLRLGPEMFSVVISHSRKNMCVSVSRCSSQFSTLTGSDHIRR